MASKESYLRMLPTGIREPLRKLFDAIMGGNVDMGTLVADVTGDLTGDVTGDLTGDVKNVATNYAADSAMGDVDFATQLITLDSSGASVVISGWTPTVGKSYVLTCTAYSNTCTVALSSGITWDGTNDLATFDAAGETITVVCVSATRLMVIANPNSIAFS